MLDGWMDGWMDGWRDGEREGKIERKSEGGIRGGKGRIKGGRERAKEERRKGGRKRGWEGEGDENFFAPASIFYSHPCLISILSSCILFSPWTSLTPSTTALSPPYSFIILSSSPLYSHTKSSIIIYLTTPSHLLLVFPFCQYSIVNGTGQYRYGKMK